MGNSDVVTYSVDERILLHIFFSPTHKLIISETFSEYLQERRLECAFSLNEIERALERLRYGSQVAFQRTGYGAKEYLLTDSGINAVTQLLGVTEPDQHVEGGRTSLWSSIDD